MLSVTTSTKLFRTLSEQKPDNIPVSSKNSHSNDNVFPPPPPEMIQKRGAHQDTFSMRAEVKTARQRYWVRLS